MLPPTAVFCADNLLDNLVPSFTPNPVDLLPRSSLPMREPSSDQVERDDQGCCISSDAEGRIIATSFPTISHPLSIRPIPNALYRSAEQFDSENTGTAIARVGRAVSPVPASQKIENARMYKWLGQPSSPMSSHVAVEGSRKSLEYRVSPGVSEIPPPQQPQLPSLPKVRRPILHEPHQTGSHEYRDEDKPVPSSDSSEILFRYEELVARLQRLERGPDPVSRSPPDGRVVKSNAQDDDTDAVTPHREVVSQPSSRLTSTDGESNELAAVESSDPAAVESPEPDRVAINNTETPTLQLAPTGQTSSPPPMATHQANAGSEGSDPNEAWKTFLFGNVDSDEVVMAAFEEAKHEAVRALQPSDPPPSLEEKMEFDMISDIATVGTRYTRPEPDDFVSTYAPSTDTSSCPEAAPRPPSTEIPSDVSAPSDNNHPFDESPLSDEMEPEPVQDCSDVSFRAPSIEVNAGTSSVSDVESPIHTAGGSVPEETESSGPVFEEAESTGPGSEEVESGTSESHAGAFSMTTSMAVAPPRSDAAPSETGTVGEQQFRFAQPKLFVGSRSNLSQPAHVTGPRPGITLTKRRRGWPRKRADDGRADIRALPNYTSDPIEEFDEGAVAGYGRVPRSRFPALELS